MRCGFDSVVRTHYDVVRSAGARWLGVRERVSWLSLVNLGERLSSVSCMIVVTDGSRDLHEPRVVVGCLGKSTVRAQRVPLIGVWLVHE